MLCELFAYAGEGRREVARHLQVVDWPGAFRDFPVVAVEVFLHAARDVEGGQAVLEGVDLGRVRAHPRTLRAEEFLRRVRARALPGCGLWK